MLHGDRIESVENGERAVIAIQEVVSKLGCFRVSSSFPSLPVGPVFWSESLFGVPVVCCVVTPCQLRMVNALLS